MSRHISNPRALWPSDQPLVAVLELPSFPPEPVRILEVVQHPVGPILRLESICEGYPTRDIFLSQVLYVTIVNLNRLESNPCNVIGHDGVLEPYAIVKPSSKRPGHWAHGRECVFLGYCPTTSALHTNVLMRPLRSKVFIAEYSCCLSLEFVRYTQMIERATIFHVH